MERLNIFNTHEDYDVESDSLPYPSVSYIAGSNSLCFTQKDTRRQYITQYLTFEALQRGSFSLMWGPTLTSEYMTSVSYSIDNGETWVTTNNDGSTRTVTTPTIDAGSKVLWKGIGKTMAMFIGNSGAYSRFSSTCRHNVSGNIMSMLYGDDFLTERTFQVGTSYNFYNLFYVDTKLISAENLIFPATVTERCYQQMFNGCTALTTAPTTLPAKTLVTNCYLQMFNGCTSLINIPELPATTLANYCYSGMFLGCTSLTTPMQQLPATTLATSCYSSMFQGCTSLITTPSLPAMTLSDKCYVSMFYNCTSLTTVPTTLPATTLANDCYAYMFSGCSRITTAPELPATTLKAGCYYYMFSGCSRITTAPELPATTLAAQCYNGMFSRCTSLNYIKAMFITEPSNTYTNSWVSGVAASGTFVKNSAATWNVTGNSGIPSGWTVENETVS